MPTTSAVRTGRLRLLATVLALALSGVAVIALPGAAFADGGVQVVQVSCPPWAGSAPGFYASPTGLIGSSPSFLTSESRIVVNELPTPITASFTSTQSHTFGVSATAGVSVSGLFGFLSANVSSSITNSTTTAIGVTAQATVPANSRVIGDYGVDAYHVAFNAYQVQRRQNIGGCWVFASNMGNVDLNAMAPTNIQGWRIRLG